MKKLLFIATMAVLAFAASESLTARDDMKALLSSPDEKYTSLFEGLQPNTRLDMIDYYEAGLKTFSNDDETYSAVLIDTLTDRHVRLAGDTPITFDLYLLTPRTDSLLVMVASAPLGNTDSSVIVKDIKTGNVVQQIVPRYTDWLVKDALKQAGEAELLAAIPYVTATTTVDTDGTHTLTMENSSITVPGLDPSVTRLFKPSLTWQWNGKQFVLKR